MDNNATFFFTLAYDDIDYGWSFNLCLCGVIYF